MAWRLWLPTRSLPRPLCCRSSKNDSLACFVLMRCASIEASSREFLNEQECDWEVPVVELHDTQELRKGAVEQLCKAGHDLRSVKTGRFVKHRCLNCNITKPAAAFSEWATTDCKSGSVESKSVERLGVDTINTNLNGYKKVNEERSICNKIGKKERKVAKKEVAKDLQAGITLLGSGCESQLMGVTEVGPPLLG